MLEYFELRNIEKANKKYPGALMGFKSILFPITAVEVKLDVVVTDMHIIPSKSLFGSNIVRPFAIDCNVGYL